MHSLFRALLPALALQSAAAVGAAATAPAGSRPNILIVYTDDQRWDCLGIAGHSFLKTPNIDRIGREGVRFANAFTTSPVCSPSRASFLTGQYKHTHGVLGNEDSTALSMRLNTFPRILHEAGYRTGYFGKWHMGKSGEPRPGFDRWVALEGQGSYLDPLVNIDGRRVATKGYVADIVTEYAARFIEQESSQPFCVIVAHKAPHSPFTPAPRHADLYANETIERRRNSRDDLSDKPALTKPLPGWPCVGPGTGPGDDQIRNQLRTLASIDEGVGRLLALLERRGELERTLVLFSSDHGYFWGEHGLGDKRAAYEEALRVPLLARYPPLAAAGAVCEAMVLNIDVAPTLLELAGAAMPGTTQGKSFLPLLGSDRSNDAAFRTAFLAGYSNEAGQPRIPTWRGTRTSRWKFVQYPTLPGMDELYDLEADPFELNNLADDPAHLADLRDVKRTLATLLAETNHPGRFTTFEGVLIDRWQAQNVRGFEDARKRKRDSMLTDGNFNSEFGVLLPDGSYELIAGADRDRVLVYLEEEAPASDVRVVAKFYDQGEGRRLVSLAPISGDIHSKR
ncbi:MAG: sulfatase family protein [Opitutaceae bacterium]